MLAAKRALVTHTTVRGAPRPGGGRRPQKRQQEPFCRQTIPVTVVHVSVFNCHATGSAVEDTAALVRVPVTARLVCRHCRGFSGLLGLEPSPFLHVEVKIWCFFFLTQLVPSTFSGLFRWFSCSAHHYPVCIYCAVGR